VAWLLWGLPPLAIVLGSLFGPFPRMLLWTIGFTVMGVACVANAAGCGRLHCYITGPLLLAAALSSVLVGLGWVVFP
jgi:hypothetical protein